MSVDVIQPTSMLPMKRARESISLSEDNVSKCGELFVTNCADKWTFYCTYCQKATSDIGVFICHIRLEHLNEQQDLLQPSRPIPVLEGNVCTIIASSLQNAQNLDRSTTGTPVASSLPSEELAANTEQETVTSHIVKEEPTMAISQENIDYEPICTTVSKILDISSLTQPASNETEDDISNKNATATSNASDELDEEFVSVTAKDHEIEVEQQQQQQNNKKIIQVVYRNVDEHKIKSKIDSLQQDVNDSATDSVNTASEDETNDNQQTQVKMEPDLNATTASGNRRKTPITEHGLKVKTSRELHICQICQRGFKSRQGVHFHISKIHDKNLHTRLPHKCAVCNRGFKTMQGLKYHKVIHENKVQYKCPLCPVTKYKLNIFITHVLTHENYSCFPCQVCGKIYATNKERMLHWKSHAKDRPFGCNICYRRFRKQQYLTHHLKAHNQYQCHFCPNEFNSLETQRPPYVCMRCEQLPDIKQKVEHLRTLSEKTHVFDSDEDISFANSTQTFEQQINQELYGPPIIHQESQQQQEHGETIKTIEVVYISDDNENESNDGNDGNDTCYTLSDDDEKGDEEEEEDVFSNATEFENNDDNRASCSKEFENSDNVASCSNYKTGHSRGMNKNVNYPLQCHKCKKGFKSPNGLKGHLKLHDGILYIPCPFCKEKVKNNKFATHVLLHESLTCFPCQVCGKIHSSNEERLKHWETHARDKPYGCNICYRRYKKQKYLLKHVKFHSPKKHKSAQYKKQQNECEHCKKCFNARKDLIDHISECEKLPFYCGKCKIGFKSFNGLKRHLKWHEDASENMEIEEVAESNEFVCENNTNEDSNTNFSSNNDSDLEFIEDTEPTSNLDYSKETITSADIIQYKCLHCLNIYTSKEILINHLAKIHGKYNRSVFPFKCKQCIKSFRSKSGLDCHYKTHDKNNLHKCAVCLYTDYRIGTYIKHVMTHETSTCFPCQGCGKIFANNTERVQHWKTHAKEKPYSCDICLRRFLYKHFLRAHMKSHGLYYCHFCPQQFNSSQTLQQPYVCGNCEKLPHIKSTVEHQRSLAQQKHVFESDEGE